MIGHKDDRFKGGEFNIVDTIWKVAIAPLGTSIEICEAQIT